MRPLWTQWRMGYILSIKSGGPCVFCQLLRGPVELDLVLHRGRSCFVILNLYPYTVGHLMVVPYRHVGLLQDLLPEEMAEAHELLARAERLLEADRRTGRQLVGLNIGRCAGAGVEGHIHFHLVPAPSAGGSGRAEIPEPLVETRDRLLSAWGA